MPPKKLKPHERIKERKGTPNYHAYLGDYADVGGSRWESLRTADWDLAFQHLSDRLDKLEEARRQKAADRKPGQPLGEDPLVVDFADRHYTTKRIKVKRGSRAESTIEENERHVDRALDFLEDVKGIKDPRLSNLDGNAEWVTDYIVWLAEQPGVRKDTTLSTQTIRNHLYSISDVLKRAEREGYIRNPIPGHPDIPDLMIVEAEWLEVGEAWRFLEVCRNVPELPDKLGRNVWHRLTPNLYEIFATFAYTGGRDREVMGLEVEDLDFRNDRVWFRPNSIRARLKRAWHKRAVPMFPDLKLILSAYLDRDDAPVTGQLFPARRHDRLVTDLRKPIKLVCEAAEITKRVTLHTWRHTYAAFRLQTLDNSHPVSPYTVMHELGHSSFSVFRKHYAHVMNVRPRYAEIAYREPSVIDLEEGRKRLRDAR